MALWSIDILADKVSLSHTQEPLAEKPYVQPCGQGDLAVMTDLEAWVCDQAIPFDLIRTPVGVFVRQNQKNQGAIATA